MKKILVVIDMQNDFITGSLGNMNCINVVPNVVNAIKTGDYDGIIYTLDMHKEDYLETNEGKHLPVPHCIAGTEGWKLHPEVLQAITTRGLTAKCYVKDTFGSLDLADHLRDTLSKKAPELQFDFCGVCTGICVISNALLVKAALPEASIRVLADACACVTEESHKTALAAMRMCHIEIA